MSYSRREFIKTTSVVTTGLIIGCSVKNQFDVIIKNGLVFIFPVCAKI